MIMRTSATIVSALAAAAALVSASPLEQRNNDGKPCLAGYTPRVGPSSAKCSRETYDITVTSENTVFQDTNSNANMVSWANCVLLLPADLLSM